MQMPSRRVLTLVLLFLCVLVVPSRAFAQGTGGTIPEPMGLRDASELLGRRIALSGAHRRAIEEAHDRYLESFARFRDSEVQDYLDTLQQVQASSNGRMPPLALLDEFLDEWRDVVKRVASIDESFFVEVASRIDPESSDAIDRARRVRARQRNIGSMGGMMGMGGVGTLDTAFWNLQPTPEEVAACDAALRSYESVMPRHTEKIAEATVGTIRMIAAILVEQGFADIGPEQMQDPARMQELMTAVQSAMAAASGAMFEAREDAEKAEITAAAGLRQSLSPARWWRLKRVWMSSAFPMAGTGWMSGPETTVPRYADMIRERLDDPAAREGVDAVLSAWYATDDALTDDLIEQGRELMARQMQGDFMAGFDGDADSMQKVQEKRTTAATSAIDRMLAFVPDDADRADLAARIADLPTSVVQGGVEVEIAKRSEEPAEASDWESSASRSRMAPGIPTPTSPDEFDLMIAMLDLDESESTIARVMLDDHLDAWSATIDPIVDRAFARRIHDENGAADPSATESQWADYREGLQASRRLDESFHEELVAAFGRDGRAEAFEGIRMQRAFDRMRSIAGSRFDDAFGIPIVEPVSPFGLITDLTIDEGGRDRAMHAAMSAAADLRPAVEGWEDLRFEEDRRAMLEQVRLMARMREIQSLPPEEQQAEAAALGVARMEPWLRRLQSRRVEADRRRQVVESFLTTHVVPDLPPLAALELRVMMLDDGRSGDDARDGAALDVARGVLRLRDLDESQAVVIETILQDHLELEIELIEAMAEAADAMQSAGKDDMAELMSRQGVMQQEIEKTAFRRRELGERLLQRLLDVLTAEQIARIPALAERSGG